MDSQQPGNRLRIAALVAVAAILAAPAVQAQGYPTRPVRLISAFPAGGTVDFLARVLGQRMTERWGEQVVVDNRGGASGNIGTEIAARAAADGHTLLMAEVGTMSINPYIFAKLPYDPVRDFAAITKVADVPLTCAAHSSLAAGNVKELVALARAKPGQVRFGSAGNGSQLHLATEMFRIRTGIEMTHVPYKGGGPALNDLLGGQIQLLCVSTPTVQPHVRQGRLKAIAVTSLRRSLALPEVPTIAESGYPGFDAAQWMGLVAPARTPRAIIERIHADVVKVLGAAETRDRLVAAGAEPVGNTPEEFGRQIRGDGDKYARVVKEAGVRID